MGQPMKQIRSRGQIIPRGERKWLLRVFLGRENGKAALEHYSQLKSVYVALAPVQAPY